MTETRHGDRSTIEEIEIWSEGNDVLIGTEVRRAHHDGGVENMRFIALANPTAILSLIERVAALEEALRPFAEASGDLDDEHPDHWHLWEHAAAMSLSAGDLRRARDALSPTNTQADE